MGREEFKKILVSGVYDTLSVNKELAKANADLLTELIDSKSKAELDDFVKSVASGEAIIPIIIPNGSEGITYEVLLDRARKMGLKLHKKIITTTDGKSIKSSIPRLVLELPMAKLAQLLDKKRSIADNQNSINHLTGQVTGPSKSMSLSMPEMSLMLGNGMNESIKELAKYRGGDANAKVVLDKMASLGMEIDQATLEKYSSGPEVNNTVKQLLLGMHLDAVIKEK